MSATATALPSAFPSSVPIAHPGQPVEHSTFWYVVAISVNLSVIIGLLIVTHLTVTRGSGLNDAEKVRRIWGRAPEIRFQPVVRPMFFALAVGYGASTALSAPLKSFFSLLGVSTVSTFMNLTLGLFGNFCAAFVGMVIYRATGGTHPWNFGAAFIAFQWIMNGFVLNVGLRMWTFMPGISAVSAFFLVCFGSLVVPLISIVFLKLGANMNLPATARLLYNSNVVQGWVKMDRTVLVAAGPLVIVYIIAYVSERRLALDTYASNVTRALSTIMFLSASALASIISVNRALLVNEMQWQWRAFLTPSIPFAVCEVSALLLRILFGNMNVLLGFWLTVHFVLGCGSCGVLGAYVYMILAERYAKQHYGQEELAQDDILAEFDEDEDEDNEELEV